MYLKNELYFLGTIFFTPVGEALSHSCFLLFLIQNCESECDSDYPTGARKRHGESLPTFAKLASNTQKHTTHGVATFLNSNLKIWTPVLWWVEVVAFGLLVEANMPVVQSARTTNRNTAFPAIFVIVFVMLLLLLFMFLKFFFCQKHIFIYSDQIFFSFF